MLCDNVEASGHPSPKEAGDEVRASDEKTTETTWVRESPNRNL